MPDNASDVTRVYTPTCAQDTQTLVSTFWTSGLQVVWPMLRARQKSWPALPLELPRGGAWAFSRLFALNTHAPSSSARSERTLLFHCLFVLYHWLASHFSHVPWTIPLTGKSSLVMWLNYTTDWQNHFSHVTILLTGKSILVRWLFVVTNTFHDVTFACGFIGFVLSAVFLIWCEFAWTLSFEKL